MVATRTFSLEMADGYSLRLDSTKPDAPVLRPGDGRNTVEFLLRPSGILISTKSSESNEATRSFLRNGNSLGDSCNALWARLGGDDAPFIWLLEPTDAKADFPFFTIE